MCFGPLVFVCGACVPGLSFSLVADAYLSVYWLCCSVWDTVSVSWVHSADFFSVGLFVLFNVPPTFTLPKGTTGADGLLSCNKESHTHTHTHTHTHLFPLAAAAPPSGGGWAAANSPSYRRRPPPWGVRSECRARPGPGVPGKYRLGGVRDGCTRAARAGGGEARIAPEEAGIGADSSQREARATLRRSRPRCPASHPCVPTKIKEIPAENRDEDRRFRICRWPILGDPRRREWTTCGLSFSFENELAEWGESYLKTASGIVPSPPIPRLNWR